MHNYEDSLSSREIQRYRKKSFGVIRSISGSVPMLYSVFRCPKEPPAVPKYRPSSAFLFFPFIITSQCPDLPSTCLISYFSLSPVSFHAMSTSPLIIKISPLHIPMSHSTISHPNVPSLPSPTRVLPSKSATFY